MSGYFYTPGNAIDLGEHVFATPIGRRQMVTVALRDRAARLHAQGGGVLRLEVTAERLRDNLGDAERWLYTRLSALLDAQPGLLACEDARGRQHAYDDCILLSGEGVVEAYKYARLTMDFECPAASGGATYGTAPGAPSTYAGTSTAQDYAVDGEDLGEGGELRIEAHRDGMLREVPRARGARTSRPYSGGGISFRVRCGMLSSANSVGEDVEILTRSIGAGEVSLTGNGNTYDTCVLDAVRPDHTDARHTLMTVELRQDVGRGGVS